MKRVYSSLKGRQWTFCASSLPSHNLSTSYCRAQMLNGSMRVAGCQHTVANDDFTTTRTEARGAGAQLKSRTHRPARLVNSLTSHSEPRRRAAGRCRVNTALFLPEH
ncbi:hypothetical protein EVAR_78543_1 [Eumeta japonica]|uniref:Uncharacterized protein n=1 Tax=Eumeta variegata TaxID=151549 RepID=A0A4C1W755_EUMVA|nr:hypothetical protein EVAR_78543_1 [Eumeta japonica]